MNRLGIIRNVMMIMAVLMADNSEAKGHSLKTKPTVERPPYPVHSGWVTININNIGSSDTDGTKLFRRYALLDPDGFQNIQNLTCRRRSTGEPTYITFFMPHDYSGYNFDKTSRIPEVAVKLSIDGSPPVVVKGEYHNGELFIDDQPEQSKQFESLLMADTVQLEMAGLAEPITIQYTEKMDGFFNQFVKEVETEMSKGFERHYNRFEAIEDCRRFEDSQKK